MSYILDALNKSEQERRNRLAPGLDSIHGALVKPPQSRRFWLILFTMLVAINGSFLYWIISKPTANKPPTSIADQEHEPSRETVTAFTDVSKQPAPPRVAELTPVNIADLPIGVQRQIPDINFSSHIYADDVSLRMVNINGRIFREGDTVADGISLVEISEDGVVLSYLHYRFEMSVLRDWSFD